MGEIEGRAGDRLETGAKTVPVDNNAWPGMADSGQNSGRYRARRHGSARKKWDGDE
jgi:hypothetical protein